jgi:chemotaxis protein histidine kinase CheA
MAAKTTDQPHIERFADHDIIRQPNMLQGALRPTTPAERDDPVARAERALGRISHEFGEWMSSECARLAAAHAAIQENGWSDARKDALFRAAHDIKGEAATFGFPTAAIAAESLCRMIEHAPDLTHVPSNLIGHHVDAIKAIVQSQHAIANSGVAEEISSRLRKIADDFLEQANLDRPDRLQILFPHQAPSLAPK